MGAGWLRGPPPLPRMGRVMDAPYCPLYVHEALRHIDTGMYLHWESLSVLTAWAHHKPDGTYVEPEFEGRFQVRHRDIFGNDYLVKILETDEKEYAAPGDWMIHDLWEHHLEKFDGDIFKYNEEMVEKPNAEYDRRLEAEAAEVEEDAGRQVAYALTPKQFSGGDFVKTKPTRANDWF